MIKKPYPYVNNPGNQSDGVLKDVADLYGKSLRVSDAHSVVDKHFSHLTPTYNGNNLPTRVKYYHGTQARRSTFTVSAAATLGGKYFKCYTAPENYLYTFWFNVNGGSTQPVVVNTHTYVEIAVSSGDTAGTVLLALQLAITGLYSNYFYCLTDDDVNTIEIITSQMGENTASDSGNTGFALTQVAGAQELVQDVEIEYSGSDPYFLGKVLKGYIYDIYAGKFRPKIPTPIQVGGEDISDSNPLPVSDLGLLHNVQYDDIQVTYPTTLIEEYEYFLSAVSVATLEVTYQDTAKRKLLRARRIA